MIDTAKIIYDADGRAIRIEREFWDGFFGGFFGDTVDETTDSYIIRKNGIFGGGETRVMKSRLDTRRSIIDKREDAKITIGNKEYSVNELPPEMRRKLRV